MLVAKTQILAHLANFSYDPVNYDWLRQLNVIDLFLDMLTESNDKWVEFAMGGICNLCIDPKNSKIIVESDGISLILKCLGSSNEETVMSTLLIIYYLMETYTNKIIIPVVIDCLKKYSSCKNNRIKNLSVLILQDLPSSKSSN